MSWYHLNNKIYPDNLPLANVRQVAKVLFYSIMQTCPATLIHSIE